MDKSQNFNLQLAQIAWVVKDINATLKFFRETMGITTFSEPEMLRLADFEGIHYDKPSDAESLVSIAYNGGIFIELIQPVAGTSIFQDYIDENPAGGMQHIAYTIPLEQLDSYIKEMSSKGYPVVMSVKHPIAEIVFFDTRKETGMFTEIMGLTKDGVKAVEGMKK